MAGSPRTRAVTRAGVPARRGSAARTSARARGPRPRRTARRPTRASSTTAGRLNDTPSPPKRRGRLRRPRACRGAGARPPQRGPHSPVSNHRPHRARHVFHRLGSRGPSRLVDEHLQRAQRGTDLSGGSILRARARSSLEHRVARPVEAQDAAAGAAVGHDPLTRARARGRRSPRRAPRATSRHLPAPRPRRWSPVGSADGDRRAPPD